MFIRNLLHSSQDVLRLGRILCPREDTYAANSPQSGPIFACEQSNSSIVVETPDGNIEA
jgi:hypothetical protein